MTVRPKHLHVPLFSSAALLPDPDVALQQRPKRFVLSQSVYSVKFPSSNNECQVRTAQNTAHDLKCACSHGQEITMEKDLAALR